MKKMNRIILGITITFAILGLSRWLNMDTIEKRHHIAAHLQELKREFKDDPTNVKPLNEIIGVLNGSWSFARTYAAGTLREIGPQANRAIPDLIRAMDCGDGFIEREAARALGSVSTGLPDAVEPLRRKVRQFKTKGGDAAWFAADSLGEIGKPAIVAIPDLEEAANSPFEGMAYSAKQALITLKAIQQQEVSEEK